MTLSIAETTYIVKGVEADVRADGRKSVDMRSFKIETGLVNQASGSGRCLWEGTDVLVGVKVQLGAPRESDLDKGVVICNVECSPSISRVSDYKEIDKLSVKASQFMNRLLNGPQGGIQLEKLCIVPGFSCWILYIDVLVLDYAGNLMDAIMMATKAALLDTRMPQCSVEQVGDKYEFEVMDQETEVVPGVESVPLCVTLNKIGEKLVVDASIFEEVCSDARITVAVSPKGNICSISKDGSGGIPSSLLGQMISMASLVGVTVSQKFNQLLSQGSTSGFLN